MHLSIGPALPLSTFPFISHCCFLNVGMVRLGLRGASKRICNSAKEARLLLLHWLMEWILLPLLLLRHLRLLSPLLRCWHVPRSVLDLRKAAHWCLEVIHLHSLRPRGCTEGHLWRWWRGHCCEGILLLHVSHCRGPLRLRHAHLLLLLELLLGLSKELLLEMLLWLH